MRHKPRPYRRSLYRADLSGYSMSEFRLRVGFIHVPILMFGATEQPSLRKIAASKEMRPYSMRGRYMRSRYDKPLHRRIAEESAIPRGSFATEKKRPNANLHIEGFSAMAPQTVAAIQAFAAANGLVTGGVARRRRRTVHFESGFRIPAFRWSVSVILRRYASQVVEALGPSALSVGTATSERVTASVAERP